MIVVCGEALVDVVRRPDGTERSAAGGGPFNIARALGRLGVPASFLGRLSSDDWGRRLAELLAEDGVSLELADIGPHRTTRAIATLDAEGHATYRFDVDGTSAPGLTEAMLPQRLPDAVQGIVVGSLGLVLEPMASILIGLVERERSRRLVMLDPNVRTGLIPADRYRTRLAAVIAQATIVKASEEDLRFIFGAVDHRTAAQRLLGHGVRLVVVTRGAHGAHGATADAAVDVPAVPVDVVDTIGAGDAFGAALLAWLHDHGKVDPELSLGRAEVEAALRYACRAAAITCSRAGADPPRRSELPG